MHSQGFYLRNFPFDLLDSFLISKKFLGAVVATSRSLRSHANFQKRDRDFCNKQGDSLFALDHFAEA